MNGYYVPASSGPAGTTGPVGPAGPKRCNRSRRTTGPDRTYRSIGSGWRYRSCWFHRTYRTGRSCWPNGSCRRCRLYRGDRSRWTAGSYWPHRCARSRWTSRLDRTHGSGRPTRLAWIPRPGRPTRLPGLTGPAGSGGGTTFLSGVGSITVNPATLQINPATGSPSTVLVLPLSGFLTTAVYGTVSNFGLVVGTSAFAAIMQPLPAPVTLTKITAKMLTTGSVTLQGGQSGTITAQLYRLNNGSNQLVAISGASCNLSANFTGTLASGTVLSCSNTSISAQYQATDAGFVGITLSVSGANGTPTTVTVETSVGVSS